MSEPRKSPGVAFWATVVLIVLVAVALYALSWGPATWFVARDRQPRWTFDAYLAIYCPIFWLDDLLEANGPKPIHDAVENYYFLWR